MIRNTLKKMTGIALTIGMILSMGATAFADSTQPQSIAIEIRKDVMIYNTSGHIIDAPEIAFNYELTTVDPQNAAVITDSQGNSATVKAGVAGAVTLSDSSLNFSTEEAKKATEGHEYNEASNVKYTKSFSVIADAAKFPAAGIYRYKLSDVTSAEALERAGIVRDAHYIADRLLDVYVSNGADGLYISGTILFSDGAKVSGFDTDSEAVADQYHTYNLDIVKNVDGAMGDKTHDFQFSIATEANSASEIFYQVDNADEASATIGNNIAAMLHHGQTLHIYGLPQSAKYIVTETNNSYDTYTVTISDNKGDTHFAEAAVARNNSAATEKIALVSGYSVNEVGQQAMESITVLNFLNAISPTGVALRVAPYAIMLIAGTFLLGFGKKFRKSVEE